MFHQLWSHGAYTHVFTHVFTGQASVMRDECLALRKDVEEGRRARDGVMAQMAEKDKGLEQVWKGIGDRRGGCGVTVAAGSWVGSWGWCSIEWKGRCLRAELVRQRVL